VKSSDAATIVEDRRSDAHQPSGLRACLLSPRGYEVLRCRTRDLSGDSICLSAPIGYGLAVGQRFEVLLTDKDVELPDVLRMERGLYATVVRTRVDVGPDGDWVDVALRFDEPPA